MKLTIINGSPRGLHSNSSILMQKFSEGYNNVAGETPEQFFLARKSESSLITEKLSVSDSVIIIFPLYCDCMPGIVLQFFENAHNTGVLKGKKIGFVVQSGFPETKHSTYVEKYLEKLCRRLGCDYLGTIIKGGVEGIQIQPPSMTKKLFNSFRLLGEQFAKTGQYDRIIKDQLLMGRYEFSGVSLKVLKTMAKAGVLNMYWNQKLKEHGATKMKDNRPYSLN